MVVYSTSGTFYFILYYCASTGDLSCLYQDSEGVCVAILWRDMIDIKFVLDAETRKRVKTTVGALCTHIRRLFLSFGGPVCADQISNCPLDRVLTYKNLIYLLNLQFASISLTMQDRAISSKLSSNRVSDQCTLGNFQKIFPSPKMAAILNF